MPYTFLDLAKRSMRLIGALNVGDNPEASEGQTCLESGNELVDSWAIERLLIYTSARQVFPLSGGKGAYEIGPKAVDWVAQRPTYIDGAGVLYAAGAASAEKPVRVLTPGEWRAERIKTLPSGGNIVTAIFYDYGFSNPDSAAADTGSGVVNVWPVTVASGSLVLYVPQAVSEFTSINQRVALPPGYRRALAYNLAVEIWSEFNPDKPLDPVIAAIAAESKANIERANFRIEELKCDLPGTGERFDIWVG